MGKVNVNKLDLDYIIELCRKYSKIRTSSQKAKLKKKIDVAMSELIKELEKFKIDNLVE